MLLYKAWKLLFNEKITQERKLKYTETLDSEQMKTKFRSFYMEQISGSFGIVLISKAWDFVLNLLNITVYYKIIIHSWHIKKNILV